MCLPLAALAPIIGGALAASGSVASAVASGNAGNAQKDAAGQAMDLQRQMFEQGQKNYQQARADMAPWLDAGKSSLGELMAQMQGGAFDRQFDPSQIANDPGYQFRMAEGQKALERSASARGLLNSGAALKSLTNYSQGMASNEFQNAWSRNQADNSNRYNRLANISGLGQTQSQGLGSLAAQNAGQMGQYANSMGGLYGAVGNAGAAQSVGLGNAINSGANTLGGMMMMYGNQGNQNQIPTQGTPYYLSNSSNPEYAYGYNPPQGPWR